MNDMDKIKILMVAINGGGDFCWNLKSFPMALNNSNISSYVLLYFKNPTKDDILKIVGKIADEFKGRFLSYVYWL